MKIDPPIPLDTGKLEKRGTSLSVITILLIFILVATVTAWIVLWVGGGKRAAAVDKDEAVPMEQRAR